MGSELADDLIKEILFRVPVKSIFKFKPVSKTWNKFLSSPEFRRNYNLNNDLKQQLPPPLLGVFQFKPTPTLDYVKSDDVCEEAFIGGHHQTVSFLSTSEQGSSINSHNFMEKLGFFHASSGGLVVCGHHSGNYYVCNPATSRVISLPQSTTNPCSSHHLDHIVGIYSEQTARAGGRLDDDDDFGYKYNVIRADLDRSSPHRNWMHIEIYNSDRGTWRGNIIKGPVLFSLLASGMCTSIRGIFFWKARLFTIAAYDPNYANDQLWLLRRPPTPCIIMTPNFGESADGLIQCAIDDVLLGFRIFVLNKKLHSYSFDAKVKSSEWVLRYTVRLGVIPGIIWRSNPPDHRDKHYPQRLAFHPDDPQFLYVRIGQNIFCCDVVAATLISIPFQGNLLPTEAKFQLLPYFQPERSPFS